MPNFDDSTQVDDKTTESVTTPVEPQEDTEALVEPQEDTEALVEPQEDTEALVEPQEDTEALVEPQENTEALVEPQEDTGQVTPEVTGQVTTEVTGQVTPEVTVEPQGTLEERVTSLEASAKIVADVTNKVNNIVSEITRLSALKPRLSFAIARECAKLCIQGIRLQPENRSIWVSKLQNFLAVMDVRSVNGYSVEATEIRKEIGISK